jgi:hypothetical protein
MKIVRILGFICFLWVLPLMALAGKSLEVRGNLLFPTGFYGDRLEAGPGFFAGWNFWEPWKGFILGADTGIFFQKSKVVDQTNTFFLYGIKGEASVWKPGLFEFSFYAGAGGYTLFPGSNPAVSNFYGKAGLSADYALSPFFKTGFYGGVSYLLDVDESMTQAETGIALKYFYEAEAAAELQVSRAELEPIFAAHYVNYYEEPVGEVEIVNPGKEAVENIRVSLWIKNYMNRRSLSFKKIPVLHGGQAVRVPVYAFLEQSVKYLDATVDTRAEIQVVYQDKNGRKEAVEKDVEVKIFHKNSIAWDDLKKLGSFITLEDPAVVDFARKAVKSVNGKTGLPANLENAVKIFLALESFSMKYVSDPKAGYRFFGGGSLSTDFLQFPRETLSKKTGDCDDFTVLLAALLESVGIRTALAAVPGHVFLLFEVSGMESPYLVSYGNRKWIPLETTRPGEDFITVWKEGYRIFVENKKKKMATALEALHEYPPLSFENPVSVEYSLSGYEMEKKFEKLIAEIKKQMTGR